jgi:hypothetical protein
MALKSETTVTGNGTTAVVIRGQDTIFVGGNTWETASVEIRSKYSAAADWYVVEETAQTANFNWSPNAGTGKSIYIDIVVSAVTTACDLDIAHLSD